MGPSNRNLTKHVEQNNALGIITACIKRSQTNYIHDEEIKIVCCLLLLEAKFVETIYSW